MATDYKKHAHAVQTAIEFNPNKRPCEPKHLRVGIDMSKADMAGLAELLIAKGVFTLEEYIAAITKSARDEAMRHRDALAAEIGTDPDNINLY